MECKPRGDSSGSGTIQYLADWDSVLAHRSTVDGSRQETVARFVANGISPEQVRTVLVDAGDALYAAARSGMRDWTEQFGGPLAVALLAAEVSALAAHLSSRASGVRAAAVEQLLDEYSAIAVAAKLGVSRQKVYEIARAEPRPSAIARVPWRS